MDQKSKTYTAFASIGSASIGTTVDGVKRAVDLTAGSTDVDRALESPVLAIVRSRSRQFELDHLRSASPTQEVEVARKALFCTAS